MLRLSPRSAAPSAAARLGILSIALFSLFLFCLAGCGGGGQPGGEIAGVVTDVDGSAVVGARVSVGSSSTTSLSNGTFVLPSSRGGYQTVTATTTIGGHRWSGETVVDVASHENNRTVTVVVSDENLQGGIGGTVIGPGGAPLSGVKVFIGQAASSTLAITDRDGYYEADKLPSGVTYTVTASAPGLLNDTKQVHVDAGVVSAASFALAEGSSQGAIPAPTGLQAQAWTEPDFVTRADDQTRSLYDAVKRLFRKKKGLPDGPQARMIERKPSASATRSWPANTVVEVDLFWTYQSFNDFFGYSIDRGPSPGGLNTVALLRDPLAAVFFDADPYLTPNVTYYYAVHRLDTIDFPDNGAEGPASSTVSANPFSPIHAEGPGQGQTVSGDPLFQWTAVPGANDYQILVFDRFPDLRSSTDPNGVVSIWTSGHDIVSAPATSQRYDGPALVSGQTYYWMVVAADSGLNTFAASELRRFREQ